MDTGKVLISSSSSTVPSPPPRPYRLVIKPLSENLRSRILEFFGRCSDDDDVSRSNDTCQLTEIEDCADPCDPESVKDFVERKKHYWPVSRRDFTPNQIPHTSGEKIYGNPVFELYSIEIKKLDPMRDFYSINMTGTNTSFHRLVIYNRNWPEYDDEEEMEITLNQPLPLKNIFRLPSALDNVTINLTNPGCGGWRFCHTCNFPDDIKYKMYQKDFKDEVTDSVASISYELIELAAVAELQFTFFDQEERSITILSGSISATTDGKQSTKRLIRQFSSSCTLQSNELVSVNRSVFGVSLSSSLHVELELLYCDGPNRPAYKKQTLVFKVPDKTESVDKDIYITRRTRKYIAKIKVKVSWWDEIP